VTLVQLFLVDDNDDFLDGLSESVAQRTDVQIVGRAHSGREALDRLAEVSPDLVLVDMTLPDMSGLELTRRIKSRPKPPRVALMTFHDSAAARLVASTAGADGLISEVEVRDKLMLLIEKLCYGSSMKRQRKGKETL